MSRDFAHLTINQCSSLLDPHTTIVRHTLLLLLVSYNRISQSRWAHVSRPTVSSQLNSFSNSFVHSSMVLSGNLERGMLRVSAHGQVKHVCVEFVENAGVRGRGRKEGVGGEEESDIQIYKKISPLDLHYLPFSGSPTATSPLRVASPFAGPNQYLPPPNNTLINTQTRSHPTIEPNRTSPLRIASPFARPK